MQNEQHIQQRRRHWIWPSTILFSTTIGDYWIKLSNIQRV